MLQKFFLAALFLAATTLAMEAQENSGGTINTLSVNPRQNLELTNSTGTESGQPNDVVPGSQGQENGLVPVTTNMGGSGSNGDMNQQTAATSGTLKNSPAVDAPATKSTAEQPPKAAATVSGSKTATNPSKPATTPKK